MTSAIDPADIDILRNMQLKYQDASAKVAAAKQKALDGYKAKYEKLIQSVEDRAKADEQQINAFRSALSQLVGPIPAVADMDDAEEDELQ